MKRIKSNKIIVGDRILSGYVYFDGDKIVEVSEKELPFEKEYDAGDLYVSPGFIDIHTHGGGGFPFEGEIEDVIGGCNFHLTHGTTSICPTISAAPFEHMARSVKNIAEAKAGGKVKSNIIGAHMEGPYLSLEHIGAQCADHVTPPIERDYSSLIEKHGKDIARWTYAPENDKGACFAKYLSDHSILPCAGHTSAIYSDMMAAMDAGCRLITHFYSCMSTVTRDHGFRRLGVIETGYLEDQLFVEMIADGKHIPPELIRLMYKIKGSKRIVLVTDSLALTGTDIVRGKMQDTEFIIEDGVCKLLDRSAFAGSIATADRLVRVVTEEAGIPLTDAIKMITETPAEIMGLNKGRLENGRDADVVVFDENIGIKKVFVMGNEII